MIVIGTVVFAYGLITWRPEPMFLASAIYLVSILAAGH